MISYGHAVGDKVLQRVGEFLKSQFRGGDIIGRIGGDEFVILMKQVSSKEAALARVQNMVERIGSIKHAEMDGSPSPSASAWPSARSRASGSMTCTATRIRRCTRQSAADATTSPFTKRLKT